MNEKKAAYKNNKFGLLIVINIIIFQSIFAQNNNGITGKIYDAATRQPIPCAVVFLKNTTLGTSADINGNYNIKNIPPGDYELVYSQAAYETHSKQITLYNGVKIKDTVFLKTKVHSLDEVTIIAQESVEWKKNLKRFIKEFIGSTPNSGKTEILNPEVINFFSNPKTEIFTASSDSQIIIKNSALGYNLYIVLNKFIIDDKNEWVRYLYFPRYEELQPKDDSEKEKWEEKRRSCYRGSLKHFLLSIIGHTLADEGFTLMGSSGPGSLHRQLILPQRLPVYNTIDTNYFEINFGDPCIHISYFAGANDYVSSHKLESSLHLQINKLLISRFGQIIAPREPVQYGHWARLRMADILPLDYLYKP